MRAESELPSIDEFLDHAPPIEQFAPTEAWPSWGGEDRPPSRLPAMNGRAAIGRGYDWGSASRLEMRRRMRPRKPGLRPIGISRLDIGRRVNQRQRSHTLSIRSRGAFERESCAYPDRRQSGKTPRRLLHSRRSWASGVSERGDASSDGEGGVQGVGFRWYVAEEARRLDLAGWVKNLNDGSVELCATGSARALAALEDAIAKGPSGARVSAVERLEGRDERDLNKPFSIVRG